MKRRATALVLLVLAVTAVHLVVADGAWPSALGSGSNAAALPKPFDISFVRELLPAAPPEAPAAPAPRARPPALAAAAPAASAPEATPPPEPAASAVAMAQEPNPTEPAASAPVDDVVAASSEASSAFAAATQASASAVAGAPFEWPPSTRLQYSLTGEFRGPVEGQASVEWRHQASRYQVDLSLSIGPEFAPLMSRSITSEGDVTTEGLWPTRYDEITRMLLRDARRLVVQMGEEQVVLAGGRTLPRPPGLQDSASQFVQLTWLFTTDPSRLRQGQQIELPLALPRRVGLWVYEVGATEEVDTPAGPVPAVHVKPRRDIGLPARLGGDLAAEVWFAPSLQYLPVRMLIRQDEQTYVELRLSRLPQQAESTAAPAAPTAPKATVAPTGR